MSARPPIWVVADAADARRFLAEARNGRVLALMPVARAALGDAAADRIDPRRNFGDWAQARTVAAVRRARQKLVAAVAALPGAAMPTGTGAIQREVALDHFLRAAYTGYRLWFTLGAAGPWMVPDRATWRHCATRDEAYEALLQHMLAPLAAGQAGAARAQTPPLAGAYRALRNLVLRRAGRNRTAFVSGARKGLFGLLDAVAAEPGSLAVPASRIVVVQSTGSGWRDYLRLARSAWRLVRGERFLDVRLLAPPRGELLAAADKLIASVDDPVIAAAFGHYRALLAYRLAQAEAALADARGILASLAPKHYLSADASRLSDWALAEAAGGAGVARWVLSRNTHVPASSRLAEDMCSGYFLARHPESLVDRYLFWTPHGAAAARALLPRELHGAIAPVAAVAAAPQDAGASSPRPRRIIVADTYASFWFTHSWAFQTSDEYMDGLVELIRTVEALPETTLLIRAKGRRELDLDAYRKLLPASAKVEIKIRDVPFYDDLVASDLLVAFRSTTIEEALHARRPALLWGGTARYRYLPARTAPPHPGDRATIYAAATPSDLGRLLPAILDQHSGKPLTDAEIAPHVWPRGTPGIADLAREMLGATRGDMRKAA